MFEKLPDLIDPVHCAKHNMHFRAGVKQSEMKRLAQQLVADSGLVEVDLNFYNHPGLNSPAFNLAVKTRLQLQCQLTMESFEYSVETTTKGVFVASLLLAEDLTEDIEVYELAEEKISLLELVEDEVLLAIPMVPRKPGAGFSWQDKTGLIAEEPEQQTTPFAQLATLIKH